MDFHQLRPQSTPYKLIRLGGRGDGAYILPNDLQNIEACFSPGVSDSKLFEDDLTTFFNINCHMCDFSTDLNKLSTPLIKTKQTFEKKWLDVNDLNDTIRLENWIEKYCGGSNKDLILQMDIEEAEYRNIVSSSSELLNRFRIIIIEIHHVHKYLKENIGNYTFESLINKLLYNHRVVHVHGNNSGISLIDKKTKMNIPDVMELTLLRKDRFTTSSNKLFNPVLPNTLDIKTNVPTKPMLILNKHWHQKLTLKIKVIRTLTIYKLTFINFLQSMIYKLIIHKLDKNIFIGSLRKIYHFLNKI